ncbi:hypothetical protein KSP40_PGU018261 [Platanthera guangdongensis]|uniref:Dirigent protein n=1 Tax=Platanthera guangdongensis TaxID=2320717 RepID=A0ABR2MEK7_9ASPA
MARVVLLFLLSLLPLLSYHLTAAVTASGSGGRTDGLLRGNEKERLTRLRFYWHDAKSASSFGGARRPERHQKRVQLWHRESHGRPAHRRPEPVFIARRQVPGDIRFCRPAGHLRAPDGHDF